jgi:hypothetical protein
MIGLKIVTPCQKPRNLHYCAVRGLVAIEASASLAIEFASDIRLLPFFLNSVAIKELIESTRKIAVSRAATRALLTQASVMGLRVR